MPILSAMEGAVSQGILWGLMTLGVYFTFRILNVADMTVDGSFATEVTNMQYSEDNLSDIVITENTLQSQAELRAGIKDVNALFGIESQIENAQIIMAIDSTAKTFKYLEINYTLVDDVTTYDTTIIVTVA